MNQSDHINFFAADTEVPQHVHRKAFSVWIMLALLLTLCAARADGPDDDYLAIYGMIDQADTLAAGGKTSQAHAKYIEAERALTEFKRDNPGWNDKTVSYRMNYLADKVAATTHNAAVKGETASVSKSPVTLLDAGSEPRTVLRLHPAAGDKQTVSMTRKTSVTMSVGGNSMPEMETPAVLITLGVEVKNVSADGDITYGIVFNSATVATDASTMPALAAAMKSSIGGIQGLTGSGKVSSQGIDEGFELDLPADADRQLKQALDEMKDSITGSLMIFPGEAVGAGAKWEYTTRINSSGMMLNQTEDFELISVQGDTVSLRMTVRQTAANQKIESPAMPGMIVNLTKMTGDGAGTCTLHPGQIMPLAGTFDQKAEMVMDMSKGQQKQAMDMKLKLNITVESK